MPLSSEVISPEAKRFSPQLFQKAILRWFRKEGRKLPWRETSDPYRIWISETMCQQTGVSTVIPYYERFIQTFPDIHSLASAKEAEVLKAWEGLGYYRRARNLWSGAKFLVENFSGRFPKNHEDLLSIPGIGPYTAGAILSIAHRLSSPALDGNLIRVFARYFLIEEAVDQGPVLKKLWRIATELSDLSSKDSRDYLEGLMDLGAIICTPKKPRCLLCPIREGCGARLENAQDKIPWKAKKLKRIKNVEWIFWFERGGRIGFLKKGSDPKYPHFHRLVFETKDQAPKVYLARLKYSVTVRDFDVYLVKGKLPKGTKLVWKTRKEIEKLMLPAIDRKILKMKLSTP